MPGLEKISAAQVDGMMLKAAHTIRAQNTRITELESELGRRDRKAHAEKIAHQARERGLMDEDQSVEYAEQLATGSDDLQVVEDFVNRSAAGVPLGTDHEKTASTEPGVEGQAEADFASALLNSDLVG